MFKKISILLFFIVAMAANETRAQEGMLGEVKMFAGNFAPKGWAFCEGQLLSIASNQALFSILGTTYGGDGRTTFRLPDLRGRAPIGVGQGPQLRSVRLGDRGGVEQVNINGMNLPSHSHGEHNIPTVTYNADNEDVHSGGQSVLMVGDSPSSRINMKSPDVGGNMPIYIRNPFLGMNYIICIQGPFPSRN